MEHRKLMQNNKLVLTAGLAFALLGLVLAPRSVAVGVVGAGPDHLERLVLGLWLLKLLLLVHGALLVLWPRLPRWGDGGSVLAPGAVPMESAPRWATPAALAIVVIGLGLRLPQLGAGLWFDEIQTLVTYVRLPFTGILTTFDSQNQHILYSLTARLAVTLLGESGFALRLPAVLFGAASLYAVYRFGRLVGGWREGLLAAGLLAASYHHVWFSQNARGYTGLLLWTLLASECLIRLLTEPREDRRTLAAGYALTMALAVYTHSTAALVGVAHALILGWVVLRGGPVGRGGGAKAAAFGILLSASVTLLLYAPVLPQFIATLTQPTALHAETEWQNPAWLAMEVLGGLARGLPGGWVTLVLGLLVLLAGLASYARQSAAILTLLVLPGLLTLVTIMLLGHNLWPRFFFFSAGFAALIVIRGGIVMARRVMPRHAETVAVAATLLVIAASGLTVPRAWGPKQDYAGAAAFVDAARGPNDATVTVDLTEFPYARYYLRDWPPVAEARALEAIEHGHARTWVLYTFPVRLASAYPDLWSRLQSRYEQVAVFPGTVAGGEIVILASPRP